jgi:soluble lytic murein transglycosylase-like protein
VTGSAADGTDPVTAGTATTPASPAEQTAVGIRHEHAEGVAQDYGAAIHLYCSAGRAGHGPAQYRLGWMYANGRGVARDDTLAAEWFTLAAAGGDEHAARMVRVLPAASSPEPVCRLPDGTLIPPPLRSVANPSRDLIGRWVRRLAPRYGLDPELVLAVIRAESNFDPRAHSPKDARGLMQLLPATARRFGVVDVWDPLANVQGGMAYLRWLIDHFDGDLRLALAGYNAGERAVRRHGGIPPYAETRAYVKRVTRVYARAARMDRPS